MGQKKKGSNNKNSSQTSHNSPTQGNRSEPSTTTATSQNIDQHTSNSTHHDDTKGSSSENTQSDPEIPVNPSNKAKLQYNSPNHQIISPGMQVPVELPEDLDEKNDEKHDKIRKKTQESSRLPTVLHSPSVDKRSNSRRSSTSLDDDDSEGVFADDYEDKIEQSELIKVKKVKNKPSIETDNSLKDGNDKIDNDDQIRDILDNTRSPIANSVGLGQDGENVNKPSSRNNQLGDYNQDEKGKDEKPQGQVDNKKSGKTEKTEKTEKTVKTNQKNTVNEDDDEKSQESQESNETNEIHENRPNSKDPKEPSTPVSTNRPSISSHRPSVSSNRKSSVRSQNQSSSGTGNPEVALSMNHMKPPSNINLSSTRAPNQPLVNHTFSLLLIGNEGVGKSSLLRRFFQGSFTQQYLPTIGIDFLTSTFVHPNTNSNSENNNENNAQKHQLTNTTPTSANSTNNGNNGNNGNNVNTPSLSTQSTQKQDVINLLLYDTSGSKKFQSLIPNYLKECSVCLLCFDLTNMESYNAIFDVYLPTIHNRFGDNVILIAVGCKNDLTRQRVVVYEDIKQRTKELSIPYLETSSRNGFNVALLFNQIAKILPEISQQQMDEKNNERNGKSGDKGEGKLPNHSGVMTRDGRSGNQEGVGNEQLLDGSEGNKGGFNCMSWFKFW